MMVMLLVWVSPVGDPANSTAEICRGPRFQTEKCFQTPVQGFRRAKPLLPSPTVNTTSALLAVKLDIRVAHPVMSSKCICTAEGLFVSAKVASDLLLARIVNRVFVAGKVVGS